MKSWGISGRKAGKFYFKIWSTNVYHRVSELRELAPRPVDIEYVYFEDEVEEL